MVLDVEVREHCNFVLEFVSLDVTEDTVEAILGEITSAVGPD